MQHIALNTSDIISAVSAAPVPSCWAQTLSQGCWAEPAQHITHLCLRQMLLWIEPSCC